MIINLTKPSFKKNHSHNDFYTLLFQLVLTTKGIWIDLQDIEVTFNEAHHTYDVHIFKCEQSVGCGTKEMRAQEWETNKQVIKDIFRVDKFVETWRWVKYHPHRYTKPQDVEMVTGIRFFVPEDTSIEI